MKVAKWLFGAGPLFFIPMSLIYGFSTHWEPVGTAAIALCAGVAGMVGAYLAIVIRRTDPGPEDDLHAHIADGAGDMGVYAPWSWWPIAIAGAAATVALGLAIGWWLVGIGVALGVVALAGWVLEFSLGRYAH